MAIFTKKKRSDANGGQSGSSPPLAQSGTFSRSQGGPPVASGSVGSVGGGGILQQSSRYADGGAINNGSVGSIPPTGVPPAAPGPTSILAHSSSQSNFASSLPPAIQSTPAPAPGPAAPTPSGSGSGHTVLYPWAQRRLHYLPSALLPPLDPMNPTQPISPVRGPLSTPPFPRYGHSVNPTASLPNGDLYIFGGLVANAVKNDLYVLGCAPGGSAAGTGANGPQGQLSVGLVETRGEVPGPRVGHASVGVGNVLIVWGGDTKSRPEDRQDDSLYLLNLSTREWTRVKTHGPTPEGRYGHAAAMVGSRFFVFGGQKDDGGFMNDLVWFDLQKLKAGSPKWTFIDYNPGAVVPPKRTGHTTVTFGDSIYVFGGTDGQYHYNDTWAYDTNTQTWSELSCIGYIPVPREGHAATLVDDVMYVFGGRGVDGKDLEDLAAFKITNQRWFMFQNMGPAPSGRSGHAMATWQNKVYVLGGESYTSARADDPSFVHVLDTSKIKYPSDNRGAQNSRKSSIPVMSAALNSSADKPNGPPQVQVHPPNSPPKLTNGTIPEEELRRTGTTSPTNRAVLPQNGAAPSFGQVIATPGAPPPPIQKSGSPVVSLQQQQQTSGSPPQSSKIVKRSTTGAPSAAPIRPARPGDDASESATPYRRTMDPVAAPRFEDRAMSPTSTQQQQAQARSRAMSPTAASPINANGASGPPRVKAAGSSPPLQSTSQFSGTPIAAVRNARTPSPTQGRAAGSSEGGDHQDSLASSNTVNATSPPPDAFYYPNRAHPQTNGRAPSPAPGDSRAKDEEIQQLKAREMWMTTALAMATRKGFVVSDAVDESEARSLEALHPTMEDGTNREVVAALLQLKQELAHAKSALAEQSHSVDERVATSTRARTAALQEASYYRAKLAALESGSLGDATKLERERSLDLERKLSESLAAKALLERQVEKLESDVEHHTDMRASAEERHQTAALRADDAEGSHSRAIADYAELQRRTNSQELTIQDRMEQVASLTSATQQLTAENAALKEHATRSEEAVNQHVRVLGETQLALAAAQARTDEVHSVWQQSQAELADHQARAHQLQADLDAKHLESTAATAKAADLERILKATRDEHEATKILAAGGLAELLASHHDRETKSRDIAPDDVNSTRLKALEEESASMKQLHQDVRAKHSAALEELDGVRSREVQLQAQVVQLRSEVASLRDQHVQALDEVNRHKAIAQDRDFEAKEASRTREAAEVRVGLLRHIMGDHGLTVSDDELATRFPPMTGNETPEQLHRRVQDLEGRLEQRTRAHQELESAHEDARRELQEAEQRYRDVSRHREVTDDQLEQLHGEVSRLRSATVSPEDGARAVKTEEELEALQVRHRQLESTHLKAVQYVKGTEKMLRRMKEELTRYKERNEVLEQEVATHGSADDLRAELDAVRLQLHDLSASSARVSSEHEALQVRMSGLQQDYDRRLREQKATTGAKIQELQEELSSLDSQVEMAQRELEETHAINASLNQELKAAVSNGSHAGHAEELAAAQKKTDWLKRENAQLEKRCEIALDHMEGDRESADGASGENYEASPPTHGAAFDSHWKGGASDAALFLRFVSLFSLTRPDNRRKLSNTTMSFDDKDTKVDAPLDEFAPHVSRLAQERAFMKKETLSSVFTIACSGFALISDGLQNNIMSLTNVVFSQLYGTKYTAHWSTQLSNSLTVGTIIGQIGIGYLCDVKGRKWGIVSSTCMICIGIILVTASHGANGSFHGFLCIVKSKGHALIRETAEYQLLLGAIALPGCIVGALLVNRLGRRNTMILGFAGYLVIGLIVGCAYDKVIKVVPAFVVLYGLMQSFGNLGPGNMLGLTSSESYATAVRGTLYGFSAAVGKTGAVLGTQSFTPIRNNLGPRYTFIVAAACGLVGMIVTFFFIRNDLGGDLAIEDAEFAAYLEANGWRGEVGAAESVDALVIEEKGEKEVL
ncbi:hypothetical protein P7C70_g1551, partial [Phenoliferia sp. Uapishka_3]